MKEAVFHRRRHSRLRPKSAAGSKKGNVLKFVVVVRRNLLSYPDMNILIENSETLEYLNPAGKWTKNPLDGKRFLATAIAFRAAKLEAIGKFNIVFHIPETNQFINLDHGRGKGLPVVSLSPAPPGADGHRSL
jgi:hypothetical protein